MNNKILSIYCAVLTIAVGFLLFKTFSAGSQAVSKGNTKILRSDTSKNAGYEIAYVNIDTLMIKYKFTKKYNDEVYAKKNAIEQKYENLAKAFERKVAQYQQKGQMGTLSAEEIQNTEQALGYEQQKIVKDREAELGKLIESDEANNRKFTEEVNNFIKEYNSDGKYRYILSYVKNGNILFADESMDITADIVDGLNKQYDEKMNK